MAKKIAILDRLTRQLRSRGVKGARNVAKGRLKQYGILSSKGALTAKGRKRNSMSPAQRAKSRASRKSGHPMSVFRYNKRTNRATMKRMHRAM